MENRNTSGGVGISTVLTIIFVVLKLVGVIDWSWVWVLSPTWIILALLLLFMIIGIVCKFISML